MKNNSIIRGVIEIFSDLLIELAVYIFFPGLLYFLIGFFYHYFRNKSYLNIIIESTIMGAVLAFFIQPESIFFGWAEWALICILIIFAGGVLAFIIRGSLSKSYQKEKKDDKINDKSEKKENIEDKVLKSQKDEMKNRFKSFKALFIDESREINQDNDFEGLVQQLQDKRWQNRYKAIISLINMGDSSAIDDVRELLDDENSNVRETAATYLRANDALPKTRPENIELYPFNIKNSNARVGRISVHSDDSLDSESAKMADVNAKLREKASNLGANAIIAVNYSKGIFNRDEMIKGQGTAVLIKDTENVQKAKDSGLNFFIQGPFWILMAIDLKLLIIIPLGIFLIIYGIFFRWGYKNKTYFLAFLTIVIISAAIWVDNILKYGFLNYALFLITTGIFLFITIILAYEYLQRKSNTNLPWKDQWGFS